MMEQVWKGSGEREAIWATKDWVERGGVGRLKVGEGGRLKVRAGGGEEAAGA